MAEADMQQRRKADRQQYNDTGAFASPGAHA